MSEGNAVLRAQTAPRRIADVDVRGGRRVVLLTSAASWALGIAGAFSATVLVPLV
jgi:hypothetical protein